MNTTTSFDAHRRSYETDFPTNRENVVLTLRVYHYEGVYTAMVKRRLLSDGFYTEVINAASFNDPAPFKGRALRARYSAKRLAELQETALAGLQDEISENLEWAERFSH